MLRKLEKPLNVPDGKRELAKAALVDRRLEDFGKRNRSSDALMVASQAETMLT